VKTVLIIIAVLILNAAKGQTDPEKASSVDDKLGCNLTYPSEFPGGTAGWAKYIETNLHHEVSDNIALKKGQNDSTQTVLLSFFVDTTGLLIDVKVENSMWVHPKVAAEAIRVIKNSPKWIPATQNGRSVIYRQKQSISFLVTKE
jgi:periplasmic protein TonB